MKKEYVELYKTESCDEDAFRRLIEIVKVLQQECPWDKVQTHETLTTCMIEEAYETVEAIKKNDIPNLREELGDVLLQVVFHGLLAQKENSFSITDVINEECEKMIRRHPHIFLDENVKSVDKVLEKWENIKDKEHSDLNVVDGLKRVPYSFPALLRSFKVQSKASKIGFDWDCVEDAFSKIDEEFGELKEAYELGDQNKIDEELGDLLFSVVNTSRFLKVNPEESLNEATEKFIRRFGIIEELVKANGSTIESTSLEQLDKLWQEAKQK